MASNRRLKQARELRGWSQAKVAEQIGTDATTVSRWERGLFSPTPYFRERLCALFGKNAEELGLLESSHQLRDGERSDLSVQAIALPSRHANEGWQKEGPLARTIAPPVAPSWPERADTFTYILNSAAHDQQAHMLWEDAYVRALRGQLAEAQ
jgi:transcriptional regulator with XRE-family HTH domain